MIPINKAIPVNYEAKDNYANAIITRNSNKGPLLEETARVKAMAEDKCDKAAITFSQKYPKEGYSFLQRLDSPVLVQIDQSIAGIQFISKFYYTCNGVYLKI